MRIINEIREDNCQLLKQLIINTIDFKNEEIGRETMIGRKSFLREYCTIKFSTCRQSAHTTNILRLLWELPFHNVLYLTWRMDTVKMIKQKFHDLRNGYIKDPFKGLIPIILPQNNIFSIDFGSFNSDFLVYYGKSYDLIIADLYFSLSKTAEDKLYDFASNYAGTELLVFLQ